MESKSEVEILTWNKVKISKFKYKLEIISWNIEVET